MVPLEKIKTEVKNVKKEFKKTTLTLILGGFGVVAALAWNEAIKTLLDTLLPRSSALVGKFVYAIVVTIVTVLISYQLKKFSEE
jgi:formate/nitrite transporter FocA (FNT family)